jgi:hypothetical protein
VNHTPGKWIADNQHVFAGEHPAPEICYCPKDSREVTGRHGIARSESIANAAYIAECCNAHDALVAEVQKLKCQLAGLIVT